MPIKPNVSLITTPAAGFGVALVLGFLAERIKLPAVVGYPLAGIRIAAQLSEIGVMLLMFGVGLHFSLHELLAASRSPTRWSRWASPPPPAAGWSSTCRCPAPAPWSGSRRSKRAA